MKRRIVLFTALLLIVSSVFMSCGEDNPKKQLPAESGITSEDVTLDDGGTDETSSIEQKGLFIDENAFPDDMFRVCVTEQADSDKDGYLSDDEIGSLLDLAVGYNLPEGQSIDSLKGIENFKNLQELSLSGVNIESLDLSEFKNLTALSIHDTPLKQLVLSKDVLRTLYISNSPLKSLDVSGSANLRELTCEQAELEMLNISDCIHLERLFLRDNRIKSLDLSNFKFLSYVDCQGNEMESLITTGCDSLETLFCENNNLTELEVNHLKNLKTLGVAFNPLTVLDVSKLEGLKLHYGMGYDEYEIIGEYTYIE